MKWAAIETEDGESRVIRLSASRVVARIISEPFEGRRDAELIAAAPEMLGLLRDLRQEIDLGNDVTDELARIDAVIALATGKGATDEI